MYEELIKSARETVGEVKINTYNGNSAGKVAACILTGKGNTFTGICLELACGLGTCAEHAAICEMLKTGETVIKAVVAVRLDGKIIPPCGRCRELISQIDKENINTDVIISESESVKLSTLIPKSWIIE